MPTSDEFERIFLRAKAAPGFYPNVDDAKAQVVLIGVLPAVVGVLRSSEASLLDGTHPGPCLNYDGQEIADYTEWDACLVHMTTARAREQDLDNALAALKAAIKNEEEKANG
jgi:hypothetical protein